jgi:hypothetical protein
LRYSAGRSSLAAAVAAGVIGGSVVQHAQADEAQEQTLRAELVKARHSANGWRVRAHAAFRRGVRRGHREAVARPDAHRSAVLAGLAYGQNPDALIACARSEGYREAERFQGTSGRLNRQGSGATGPLQFMPSTFASTPQGKAGLPITDVASQFAAAAWMWTAGRRGEWSGAGC